MFSFGEDKSVLMDDELLRAGLNLMPQAISIFDSDLKLRIWNSRFLEMFSFPQSIIYRGCSFGDVIRFQAERGEYGPGDIEELVKERVELARAFKAHYIERTRPNGQVVAVEGYPISKGGWVAVYTDITTQKRNEAFLKERKDLLSDRLLQHSGMLAEANRKLLSSNRALEEFKRALTASEHRMRAITQALPALIAHITHDYRYTFSNNRYADIIGIKGKAVVGSSVAEVLGETAFHIIKPSLDQALAGEQCVVEHSIKPNDEETRIIRTTLTPEYDEDGVVRGVFILSLNVTEEKKTMEALLQSRRMETIVQLTSGLAHDFSNILTVILGNLRLIEEQDSSERSNAPLVQTTRNAAQRAVRIIEQLMSFTGKQSLEPKPTNVSGLLRDLTHLFAPSLSKNTSLKLESSSDQVYAYVDESALQDALVNLLINANDAVGEKGRITISTELLHDNSEENDMVRITVSDDGCGFDAVSLKRAYEPFYTSKQSKNGSGLGLSMAQGFAKQSGGSIDIASTLGEGATISLTLPAAHPTKVVMPKGKGSHYTSTDRHKIAILVDDEEDVRRAIRAILKQSGFSVVEAEHGQEALSLISQIEGVELVLSDIMMPGEMNGVELCDTIRQGRPDIPIMLMSGLPAGHAVLTDAQARFAILKKPLDKDAFYETYSRVSNSLHST